MKEEIKSFSNQIKQAVELSKDIEIDSCDLGNLIINGMGASGIAGDIFKNLYKGRIPVYVGKSAQLPPIAGEDTLLISMSYSGNTQETLSNIEQAIKKETAALGIASGGELEKICAKNKLPFCKIPAGVEPRSAIGYLAFSLLNIMGNSKMLLNFEKESKDLIELIEDPEMHFEEAAAQIAKSIKGKIPIIYSPFDYSALSYRWKAQINENAKQPAFAHIYPELFHNELESFEYCKFPVFIILITDPDASKEIRHRTQKFERIIQSKNISLIKIEMIGHTPIEKMFASIHLGDWVSYYLGMENEVDIKQVKLIKEFKQ